jgi:hypothetical protein
MFPMAEKMVLSRRYQKMGFLEDQVAKGGEIVGQKVTVASTNRTRLEGK